MKQWLFYTVRGKKVPKKWSPGLKKPGINTKFNYVINKYITCIC